jgi:hypothetical protein
MVFIFRNIRNAIRNEINTKKENEKIPEINKGGNGVKWTDVAMVFISAILAYYTWRLFNVATQQTNIAQQAANAAIASVRQDSINDIVSRERERINDSLNRIKDSLNISLAGKSLRAQIKSFNEAQNEFAIENRPFITITDINIDTSFSNEAMTCSWNFVNTGKFPAKVLKIRSQIGLGTDTTAENLHKSYVSSQNVNQYLAGDIKLPWSMPIHTENSSIEIIKNRIKNGRINIYFMGEFEYYSPTLKTYYKNKFVTEISYSDVVKISYLVNDEFEYKKP